MQIAQFRRGQRGQPVFVNGVKPDQRMHRPVAQRHFERERFEQVVPLQSRMKVCAATVSAIEHPEFFSDHLEIGTGLTEIIEQPHPMRLCPADPRVVHVDMHLRRIAIAAPDQERLDRQRQRLVARVPPVA